MTDETGAAAPTTEQAITAPAESEQATPKIESVPDVEASAENAEPKANETEQPEDGSEPKKLTRNQRLQRKAARLSTMVAEQAAELEKLRQANSKASAESAPKEADYNGDWTKYQADYAAWKAASIIEGKLLEREERDTSRRLQDQQREATDEFLERVEEVKTSIPDYDKAFEAFAAQGGKFAQHVIEEIRDSEKGPMLAYQLAKNPALAAELNAMSPRDCAREMGRLEAKVSLPQPKRQTQAPAPLRTVTGGAAATATVHELAKSDDVTDYVEARRKASA